MEEHEHTVLILDTCPLFIEGVTKTLKQANATAVQIAETLAALQGIAESGEAAGRLLIIGPHIPTKEGFDACRWATSCGLRKIIFISSHVADPIFAADAMHMGMSACLPVEVSGEQLLQTVSAVLAGNSLLPADLAFGDVQLSPRELDIVRLWAEGKTDAQVAEALTISKVTVRNHAARILVRMNVHNRKDAIHRARHHGLI